MARKKIKKVSVAPIDPITGSIVNTTNIDDKTVNTYSAEIIDGLSDNWVDKTSELVTTDYVNDRTHLYVNEHLKLAFLTVDFNEISKGGTPILCTVPSKYVPALPNDTVWFIGFRRNGESPDISVNFARIGLYASGNVQAVSVYGTMSGGGYGNIMYPIA